MTKALEPKRKIDKKFQSQPKINPKKELFNRLKLLDSIGKNNDESRVGSIRMGYVKNPNKMHDNTLDSKPYESYLEDESLQNYSYDTRSEVKLRKRFREPVKGVTGLGISMPNALDLTTMPRNSKDYTTVSTTLTTVDKKILESKQKIHSVIDFKGNKFTPSSHESLMSPDSFAYRPDDSISNFTPMNRSKVSISVGKRKKKEQVSKEILAR